MSLAPSSTEKAEKAKRRFKSGDPLFDQMYRAVDDLLREDPFLLKPLSYEFDEKNQEHVMTYEGQWRFRRSVQSSVVSVEQKSSKENQEWEAVNTNAVTFYSRTPVMWPISQYNISVYGSVTSKISSACQEVFKQFQKDHKDYLAQKYPDKMDLHRKFYQVESVLGKVWQKKMRTFRKGNTFSNNRLWWLHFVDRKIFKAAVSIIGTSKNTPINWVGFAALSQTLSRPEVWKNYETLGPEKVFLNPNELHKWSQVSSEELTPKDWLSVWPEVTQLPSSVQKSLLRYAGRERQKYVLFDDAFSPDESVFDHIQPNHPPLVWSVFEQIKNNKPTKAKWKPRELDMMWLASEAIQTVILDEVVKKEQFKLKNDIVRFLQTPEHYQELLNRAQEFQAFAYEFASIWKEVDKAGIKSWSYGHREQFARVFRSSLPQSLSKGELTLFSPYVSEEFRQMFESAQDKRALKKAVKIKQKTKPSRRM